MKTFLRSILIITIALLVGAPGFAQSKDADRDWVDSLAVKYRTDFIRHAMIGDQVALNDMGANVFALIFNFQDHRGLEPEGIDAIRRAVHHYNVERRAVQIRRSAYRQEILSARSNFSVL